VTTLIEARTRRLLPSDPLARRLALATLVNRFGTGLFMTISALYFTRIVGLSVTQVGLGLTIAGGFGVAAGVPAGHAVDRFGARWLLPSLVLVEAAGLVAYTQVHSMATFLPVLCLVAFVDQSSNTVRNTVIAIAVPLDERATTRAYLRAVTNVGIGAGSGVAAIALQADTRSAYVTLILFNAACFVVAAVLLGQLRVARPAPRADDEAGAPRPRRAFTDWPFLTITVLNAVLTLQFGLMEVGLPLWIAGHTRAPRILVSVVFLVNTVMIVFLQVRSSRRIDSVGAAGRAARRSGILLGAACLIYASAGQSGVWLAASVILVGSIVQTFGELISSAAGWTLSYDLAAPDAPGAYQGVFTSGFAAGQMLAPVVVTVTAIHLGPPGWAILAAVFALAGVAFVPATAWAQRTR
jgi:MFS family permease